MFSHWCFTNPRWGFWNEFLTWAGKQKDASVRFRFDSPLSSKVVVCGQSCDFPPILKEALRCFTQWKNYSTAQRHYVTCYTQFATKGYIKQHSLSLSLTHTHTHTHNSYSHEHTCTHDRYTRQWSRHSHKTYDDTHARIHTYPCKAKHKPYSYPPPPPPPQHTQWFIHTHKSTNILMSRHALQRQRETSVCDFVYKRWPSFTRLSNLREGRPKRDHDSGRRN